MTGAEAEITSESVDSVLTRYFHDDTTLECVRAALLHEWQGMERPGLHGPAMLSLTKWTIRNAAQASQRKLDDGTLYLLLEPLSVLFTHD